MKIVMAILLLLIPCIAYSEPTVTDKWKVAVGKDNSFVFAATLDDNGNLFGQYCFVASGNCEYLIAIDTSCNEGEIRRTLATSDIGVAAFSLLCDNKINDKLYRYYFTDFDEVDKIAKGSSKVGFAIPLNSDQFKVIRFDLTGADKAIKIMREIADKMLKKDTDPAPKTKNNYI